MGHGQWSVVGDWAVGDGFVLCHAETQSDVVCDLSQTYATKSELETVKQMVLDEISNLKNVVTSNSNITSMMISDSLPDLVSPSLVSSSQLPSLPAANAVNTSYSNLGFDLHIIPEVTQ